MATIRGKALIVLTKRDDFHGYSGFFVAPYVQTALGGPYAHESAEEDLMLLEYEALPLPVAAWRMKVGETMRISVVYRLTYSRDYFGETSTDLEYDKVRVLRHQKAPKYYRGKEHATHSS